MSVSAEWKPVIGQALAAGALIAGLWLFVTRPIKARSVAAAEALSEIRFETDRLAELSENWGGDGGALLAEVTRQAARLDRAAGSDAMGGWDGVRMAAARTGVTVVGVETEKVRGVRAGNGRVEREAVVIECAGPYTAVAAFCDAVEGLGTARAGAVTRVEELRLAPGLDGGVNATVRLVGSWLGEPLSLGGE